MDDQFDDPAVCADQDAELSSAGHGCKLAVLHLLIDQLSSAEPGSLSGRIQHSGVPEEVSRFS